MSLGGRPKEEGGHKRFSTTLNNETLEGLRKVKKKGQVRSKFIEIALGPLIRELDPGDSCKVLYEIDCLLGCRISSATSKQNFEKAAALTAIGNALDPFRSLCRPTKKDITENVNLRVRQCSCKAFLSETE